MYSVTADIESLRSQFQTAASIKAYYDSPTQENRNKFIDGRIALTNLAYVQFVSELTADKQHLDAATDMLILGLNLFGTATGAIRAKANLAASAAGIGGSKAIVDKHYYFEKTVPALIATMNAKRKEILTNIVAGSKRPQTEYSFTQAIADTHEYYGAGTLNGAIATIHTDAAIKDKNEDVRLLELREAPVLTDDQEADRREVSRKILAAIRTNDLIKMQAALKLLGLEGLPQSTPQQAADSLSTHYRSVLVKSPDLPSKIKNQL